MKVESREIKSKINQLIDLACRLGATGAKTMATGEIIIEDHFAKLCEESPCPNYGKSASCPPHVIGPEGFRKMLKDYTIAMVFKIEMPLEVLLSSVRREVFELLHTIAAKVELSAIDMGFTKAKAFVGNSCKEIFCYEEKTCRVVDEKGKCRHPKQARPSMSGHGINVSKLMKSVGWSLKKNDAEKDEKKNSMESVCGLVLIH